MRGGGACDARWRARRHLLHDQARTEYLTSSDPARTVEIWADRAKTPFAGRPHPCEVALAALQDTRIEVAQHWLERLAESVSNVDDIVSAVPPGSMTEAGAAFAARLLRHNGAADAVSPPAYPQGMTTIWAAQRRLFVAWRDPETRRIWPVGVLAQKETTEGATRFSFGYLKQAETLDGFRPFTSFPTLHQRYDSDRLFPLFANRVMPRDRSDFGDYLERLDLDVDADPFEILSRSGGRKTTDRLEVFPEPEVDAHSGQLGCLFFARGIRHLEGAEEAVSSLEVGEELLLAPDPANAVNPRALVLEARTRRTVGYVPDYLLDFFHDTSDLCETEPQVTVEHVNGHHVASHLRLLCRVRACRPDGYEPFAGPQFQTLVPLGD